MKKTLDLHGLKHEYVFRTVDHFISEHILMGTDSIHIITGNSNHMKDMVINIANDYGIICEDVWGNYGILFLNLK